MRQGGHRISGHLACAPVPACRLLSPPRVHSAAGPGRRPTLLPAASLLRFCSLQLLPSANLAGSEADLDLEAVHAALRGVLLRLQFADASLARLPEGCSFEVVAYTTGRGGATGVPQDAWVEEQPAPGHLELVQVGARDWECKAGDSMQGRGQHAMQWSLVGRRRRRSAASAGLSQRHLLLAIVPLLCWQAEIVPIKSCSLEGAFQLNLFAES